MELEQLKRQLFALEMDDFAYAHGLGAKIAELQARIAELEKAE